VVITKVDALELENEIGDPAAHALLQRDPSITSVEDARSSVVRDFLCNYGLDDFVRELELHFSNVKYFSCSALGRLPVQGDTRGFTPRRVVEPLLWLLAQTKAIKVVPATSRATLPLPETVQQTIPQITPLAMQQMGHSTSMLPETVYQTTSEATPHPPVAMQQTMPWTIREEEEW
jgi:hypothetical protein